MQDISFLTIKELKNLLDSQKISKKEVVQFFLARAKDNKDLNAVIDQYDINSILSSSSEQGLLSGIPGYIKSNICQKDRITSCASKILENFKSTYDATVVERLKAEGAVSLGSANNDEFAMGSSGETSAFGVTKNPWNKELVPGGSSSGSAAAVAAGLAPWALGSDTGGSVRQPAALCGIVGFKPTYGLNSRFGLIAYGSSLDTIGIFTRTVYDNAMVLSAIAGQDEKDSTSLPEAKKDYTKNLDGSIKPGLTIGVIDDAFEAQALHPEIRQANEAAIKEYEKMGAIIKHIRIPSLDYGAACYFIISRAEAASNLARFDGIRYGLRVPGKSLVDLYEATRHDGFGTEVKARILVGNYVLSVGHAGQYYDNAQRVRQLIRQQLAAAFKEVDILVMPTHATPAFKVGEFDNDKLTMDLQDYFTAPLNLAGVPGISIPVGFSSKGLPLGMQLVGSHLSEELLFQTAHAYQQITDWHRQHPSL
jgi:aspartyl-tRNA(Asn)/glutamyl-tRNA(Gln) amidotransferase subunit A